MRYITAIAALMAIGLLPALWMPQIKPIAVVEPEIVVDTLYPLCPRCGHDSILYFHSPLGTLNKRYR